MPRHARRKSESGIYHIMLRGINKQVIFEDDEDRQRFIEVLRQYKEKSKYEVYSYCLMDNHVHLLLKEVEDPIATIIKRISSSYVYWYNIKYGRCGHLFQDRFRSEVIENERHFLTVIRYIHQNPVKDGVTKSVSEYHWSSYKEYLTKASIVDAGLALGLLSGDSKIAIELFKKHSAEKIDDIYLDYNEKCRLSDSKTIEIMAQLGFPGSSELQQMDRQKRNEMIKRLKMVDGVTIRQLSRLTGISKSVIDRIH